MKTMFYISSLLVVATMFLGACDNRNDELNDGLSSKAVSASEGLNEVSKKSSTSITPTTSPSSKTSSPISIQLNYSGNDIRYKGTVQLDSILQCHTQGCLGKTANIEYMLPVGFDVVSETLSYERIISNNSESNFPLKVALSSIGEFKISVRAVISDYAAAASVIYISVKEDTTQIISEEDFLKNVIRKKTANVNSLEDINHTPGMIEEAGPSDK